jgi:hypothetical protein
MRPILYISTVSIFVLLGDAYSALAVDKMLVPGDPPLTQSLLDKRLKYLEWLLDTRFTANQQAEYESLFVQVWKNAKPAQQRHWDEYMTADAERLVKMGPEERVRQQQATLLRSVAVYEKSTYPGERWIAAQYLELYKPGGANNPIVVAGDPPLTKTMLDIETAFMECVLDLNLTVKQRAEHQRLFVENWKGLSQEQRVNAVKGNNNFAKLPTYRAYGRDLTRALNLPRLLKACAEKPDDPRARWFLPLYEARTKPGGDRNPVLVEGKPQLTQVLVDRYGDYLEVMLDLSITGGFTQPQRQVLQDYLVKDWKKMTAEERDELLIDLKRWEHAAGQGIDQAKHSISALRPKLMAQLSTARRDARSQWLLEIAVGERKKEEQAAKDQQMMFDAMRFIISKMDDGSHWETRNGRLIWVPGR